MVSLSGRNAFQRPETIGCLWVFLYFVWLMKYQDFKRWRVSRISFTKMNPPFLGLAGAVPTAGMTEKDIY